MVITLIGYRGSGKSSVAKLLAATFSLRFVDSDIVIEQSAGCSIRRIFDDEGEAGFRRREGDVIEDLTSQDSLVIATGGGAVLSDDSRRHMKAAGPVIWLKAGVQTLALRISRDDSTSERRPTLTGQSVLDEIASLLSARQALYQDTATHVVDTEGLTPVQVADQICALLNSAGAIS